MELPPSTSHDSSHTDGHGAWDRQIEYILVCCGFVNSIGSYLEFPQLSAQHGGGQSFYVLIIYLFIHLSVTVQLQSQMLKRIRR